MIIGSGFAMRVALPDGGRTCGATLAYVSGVFDGRDESFYYTFSIATGGRGCLGDASLLYGRDVGGGVIWEVVTGLLVEDAFFAHLDPQVVADYYAEGLTEQERGGQLIPTKSTLLWVSVSSMRIQGRNCLD